MASVKENAQTDGGTQDGVPDEELGPSIVEAPADKSPVDICEPDQDNVEFVDHFSLRKPSSTIRLRNTNIHVYDLSNDQLVLQDEIVEQAKHRITVKRLRAGTFGLRALRAFYTLISLLMLGVLFVFCAQVVLLQFLEIPRYEGNATGYKLDVDRMLATLFSLPLFLYSLGSLMVLATAFVGDTWGGHGLYAMMLNFKSNLTVEWFCFAVYIVIPFLTMMITLFVAVQNWWEISCLVWIGSIFLVFVCFSALVIYHELKLCYDLVRIQHPELSFWNLVVKTIITTQTQRYAGIKDEKYLMKSTEETPENVPVATFIGPYSRTTLLRWNFCFTQPDPPQRRYTIEEIRDTVPYVTENSWSLEKMYCRSRNARTLYAVSGENARSYILSTIICTGLGFCIFILCVIAYLTWSGLGTAVIAIIVVVILLCSAIPVGFATTRLYQAMPPTKEDSDDDEQVLYHAWQTFTVSKPKIWYCWFRVAVDVVLIFLFPMITMYASSLPKFGTLYLVLGLFSSLRLYFDASLVLTELGTVQDVRLANTPEEEQSGAAKAKALVARARSSEIMGKITRANGVFRWSIVFGIVAVVGLVLVLSSPNDEGPNPQGGRPLIPLLDDFYYPPQPDLAYPACKLTKGFEVPGQGFSYMTDYILLAGLSYETANVTEYVLDKWFGSVSGVIDEVDFVDQWRRDNNLEAFGASFKLFSIPSMPGFGVVSVRGTQTATDNLLNAQLYMTSILMQFVRAALPLGWIFEDVYDDLITAVGWIGSEHLRKSAYYTVTTAFVNDLLQNNYTDRGKSFNTLRITGVSLGGGIAMITGAQTDANAVVFAGINPTLARQTFVPPLSLEAINTRLFNVHPEGDFKSLIGDLPRNFQKIGCIAPRSESSGCHSFWRGFCEFMVTCGSETRPVDCRCVQNYGYPKPIQNGTRSFEQACAEEEAIVKELG